MHAKLKTAIGCVVLPFLCGFVTSNAIAESPKPGLYNFSVSNGKISGPKACNNLSLFYYVDGGTTLSWPGYGETGAKLHKVEPKLGANLRIITFPTTPASAAAIWKGPFSSALFPGGAPADQGTLSATITEVDADSFTLTYSFHTPVAGGICSLANDVTLIRTGGLKEDCEPVHLRPGRCR